MSSKLFHPVGVYGGVDGLSQGFASLTLGWNMSRLRRWFRPRRSTFDRLQPQQDPSRAWDAETVSGFGSKLSFWTLTVGRTPSHPPTR